MTVGWIDPEVNQSRPAAAAVTPMGREQEAISEELRVVEHGSAAQRREALEKLAAREGTDTESAAFLSCGGTLTLLSRRRSCPAADVELYDLALTKLSTEKDLRAAARGDEASYDAMLEGRGRLLTFLFSTVFAIVTVGLLVFAFFFLTTSGSLEGKGGRKHALPGLTAFFFFGVFTLALSLLVSYSMNALYKVYELRFTNQLSTHDKEVASLLEDGTLRLLSVEWLKTTTLEVMPRSQELPPEAFVPPKQAKELYRSKSRSVGVLSYRWLRPEHPDPCGQRLATLKAFLNSTSFSNLPALFWDFASLPQKGVSTDGKLLERTDEEAARFKRGLSVMGNLYASLECTAVLQLRAVPTPPAERREHLPGGAREFNLLPYERSGWCNFEQGAASLVVGHMAALRRIASAIQIFREALHEGFHQMLGILMFFLLCCGGFCATLCRERDQSKVSDSQRAKRAKQQEDRARLFYRYVLRDAAPVKPEQRRAEARQLLKELGANKVTASRHYFAPKLVEISNAAEPQIVDTTRPPSILELRRTVEGAVFAGKGDHLMVVQMLDDFDKLMSGKLTKEKAAKRYKWVRKARERVESAFVEPTVGRALRREKTRHIKSTRHLAQPPVDPVRDAAAPASSVAVVD